MTKKQAFVSITLAAAACLWLSPAVRADVKPNGMFTDGAVLQRGIPIPVWGTAANGEEVTVSLDGHAASTVAKDGKWEVRLKALPAGGPYTLAIAGQNRLEIKDVLIGEVWICSGQSNMELPLSVTANAQETISKSDDPLLRLLTIPRHTSESPQSEVNASWQKCGPDTAPRFSAVGYYFGRDLRKELHVPVGLIHTSWGGTVCEAWTSQPALEAEPSFAGMLAGYARTKHTYPQALLAYDAALAKWESDAAAAKAEGKPAPRKPNAPVPPNVNPNRPAVLYNAMIAPLIPYGIKGAIWYQGEANAGRAFQYQTLLPAMIRDWRSNWGEGEFPFYLVQLAPFMAIESEPKESAWAELREAQRLTTLRMPHTGEAVITDVGEENDIHPKKKEPVGHRLALDALALDYGKKIEYSGPTYRSLRIHGNQAVIHFHHVGGGLTADGGKVKGFTIAGPDKVWVNADAVIQGNTVVVSSPRIAHPVAVRYGWANFPVVNLANKEGIPASPFRTDDFRLTTQPK